jgi:hypothetical protein
MATYTVTHKYLLDDFAVLQLLTPTELVVGGAITVAGVDATFNGSYTVYALPQYLFLGVDTEGDLLFNYQVPIQTKSCTPRPPTTSSASPHPAPSHTHLSAPGSPAPTLRTG